MRVTEKTKTETRKKIQLAAKRLFASQGFSETATREISVEAGVAAGTLFNYFPTKEAIVISLATEAAQTATDEYWKRRGDDATLDEDLFALIATYLKRLKPLRKFIQPVIDTVLHPVSHDDDSSSSIRTAYFESLHEIFFKHDLENKLTSANAHLHWSLVVGVLSFWTTDTSPKQEDTLALLDQSVQMFLDWLHAT